ncbi:phenoloxidase-activating factor 2 [Drosophila teissieri]|uniref:phenoloxidase-activating factor 2 n=1 Tax=Drosophila teissieri TaxID=7243 RepID=UPI001CBA434C|nr:phenoloxidase-activating factor 2 [Drosophila teissieri]
MRHCWAIADLLLASVLMGNACRHFCVPQNLCLYEAPIFDYRSSNCGFNHVCCEILRENFYEEKKPDRPPLSIKPNGPEDNEAGANRKHKPPSTTRGPAENRPNTNTGNSFDQGEPRKQVENRSSASTGNNLFPGGQEPQRIVKHYGGHPTTTVKPPTQVENPSASSGNNLFPGGQTPGTNTNLPDAPQGILNNYYFPTNVGNLQPLSADCGMSNPNGLQFTGVTWDQARPAQYPWAVALFHKGKYLAGGSLITPDVVLTVAHRLVSVKNSLLVRAGDWDLKSDQESFVSEQREVVKVAIHEGFIFSTGANNVALLFLKSPFQLSDHIRTICLPAPSKSFEGRRCTVAGWGKMKFEDQTYSSVLKKVEVPMINRTVCENQLRTTRRFPVNYQLPENLICAGGEFGRDACTGDGGSALFCEKGEENSGIYEQAGIVNFGIGCSQENIPAIYTEVSQFIYWIREKLLSFDYRSIH